MINKSVLLVLENYYFLDLELDSSEASPSSLDLFPLPLSFLDLSFDPCSELCSGPFPGPCCGGAALSLRRTKCCSICPTNAGPALLYASSRSSWTSLLNVEMMCNATWKIHEGGLLRNNFVVILKSLCVSFFVSFVIDGLHGWTIHRDLSSDQVEVHLHLVQSQEGHRRMLDLCNLLLFSMVTVQSGYFQ